MKKLTAIIPLILFSICGIAQIDQIEIKPAQTGNESANTPIPYDSTEYYDPGNYHEMKMDRDEHKAWAIKMVRRFIGQEVLVLPKSHKYQQHDQYAFVGYGAPYNGSSVRVGTYYDEDFYRSSKRTHKEPNHGKYMAVKGQFISGLGDYNWLSDYKALADKKFKITDYTDDYFVLRNEETDELIYYHGPSSQSRDNDALNIAPPLLLVGYVEKLKQQNLGKNFYYTGPDATSLIDNNTGNKISNATQYVWSCYKIGLADYDDAPYQKLTFILKDSSGHDIAIEKSLFLKSFTEKNVYDAKLEAEKKRNEEIKAWQEKQEKEKAEQEKQERLASKKEAEAAKARKIKHTQDLINKYGYEIGTLISNKQVKLGMTKEMCVTAWGKPFDIHTSEGFNHYSEQWVYGLTSYLYFNKDGILDFIQN